MHSRFTHTRNNAFSLVELSIVLVILGLLTGGILAGQSLIRAAELRSVSTEFNRYQSAVYAFRDKYFAVPGDMNNATSFWGDQATGAQSCASALTADGTPGTCNGDGNGAIDIVYDDGSNATALYESPRSWQHLSLSGLVEGSYTGIGTGTIGFGTNAPKSKLGKAGWGLGKAEGSYFTVFSNDQLVNTLFFGGAQSFAATAAVLKPEEAWNLDTKMDDANPGRGRVYVDPDLTNCYTGTLPSTAYALSTNTIECTLRWILK